MNHMSFSTFLFSVGSGLGLGLITVSALIIYLYGVNVFLDAINFPAILDILDVASDLNVKEFLNVDLNVLGMEW